MASLPGASYDGEENTGLNFIDSGTQYLLNVNIDF